MFVTTECPLARYRQPTQQIMRKPRLGARATRVQVEADQHACPACTACRHLYRDLFVMVT